MRLQPTDSQLDWFFESVYKFHETVAKKMMGYFETGLHSTELDYMSLLAAKNRTNMTTSYKMMFLAKSFEMGPKVPR